MLTQKKLTSLFNNSARIPFCDDSKIVFMSDAHRGEGGSTDEFARNQNIFLHALNYYFENDFLFFELGDGEELWENRQLHRIEDMYHEVYEIFEKMRIKNRFFRIFGNHDRVNKKKGIPESLVLRHSSNSNHIIFLSHGHQGDIINDQLWRLGRFLVRYVWRPLQIIGMKDPTHPARNYKKKNKISRRLSRWANKNKILSVFGHTHRPTMNGPNKSFYVNCGSGIHPEAITGVEIENGKITLMTWKIRPRLDGVLHITRDVLASYKLKDYFSR
ncbi:MAG: metallophosphoesterase family protein [Firmicutes bacterium]|nr:metallophosphoesterase family protein [Bacillota bacterium]